jgi:hypothetical protein
MVIVRFCLRNFLVYVLIFVFETRSHCVSRAGLKLEILLPPSTKCWDYRCEPLHLTLLLLLNALLDKRKSWQLYMVFQYYSILPFILPYSALLNF